MNATWTPAGALVLPSWNRFKLTALELYLARTPPHHRSNLDLHLWEFLARLVWHGHQQYNRHLWAQVSTAYLAQRFSVARETISRALARLQRRGLLRRRQLAPRNGSWRVALTLLTATSYRALLGSSHQPRPNAVAATTTQQPTITQPSHANRATPETIQALCQTLRTMLQRHGPKQDGHT